MHILTSVYLYPKYCTTTSTTVYCICTVYCTALVQLPMRVLCGTYYGYAPNGDDQSPNVAHHNYIGFRL